MLFSNKGHCDSTKRIECGHYGIHKDPCIRMGCCWENGECFLTTGKTIPLDKHPCLLFIFISKSKHRGGFRMSNLNLVRTKIGTSSILNDLLLLLTY